MGGDEGAPSNNFILANNSDIWNIRIWFGWSILWLFIYGKAYTYFVRSTVDASTGSSCHLDLPYIKEKAWG
jgi:hypothetical protein